MAFMVDAMAAMADVSAWTGFICRACRGGVAACGSGDGDLLVGDGVRDLRRAGWSRRRFGLGELLGLPRGILLQ